jgi:hypothetical protein
MVHVETHDHASQRMSIIASVVCVLTNHEIIKFNGS